MRGAIYFKESGRIEMVVDAPTEEDIRLQLMGRDTVDVYLGAIDIETQYMVGSKPQSRPTMELGSPGALEVAPNTPIRIENIPAGTRVIYPGGELIVDDGFIEWSAVEPGTYTFRFENWPYLEETIDAIVR